MGRRAVLLAGVTAGAAPAQADDWSSVAQEAQHRALIARIERFYRRHPAFEARFEQTTYQPVSGRRKTRAGRLRVLRPGHFSFAYDDGDWVGTNEKRFRAFLRDEKVLYSSPAKRALPPYAKALLEAPFALDASFRTELRPSPAPGVTLLMASPRAASPALRSLWVLVDTASGRIDRVLVADGQGNTTRLRLIGFKAAPHLKKKHFGRPKTPRGTKVVTP
ncbi:MAG: outer membrane lipoprotein carrier protein LolA [Myxococcota bacterium]